MSEKWTIYPVVLAMAIVRSMLMLTVSVSNQRQTSCEIADNIPGPLCEGGSVSGPIALM